MSKPANLLEILEERVLRLELVVSDLEQRVEGISKGWGTRLNDIRQRYDAQHDRLDERITKLEGRV